MRTLSEKLKFLRKEQRLSQEEVAERLQISRQSISGWERGDSHPTPENLNSIGGLYQVPVDFLLSEEWDTVELEEARTMRAALMEKKLAYETAENETPETTAGKEKVHKGRTAAVLAAAFLIGTGMGIFIGRALPQPIEEELIPWEDTEQERLPADRDVEKFELDW